MIATATTGLVLIAAIACTGGPVSTLEMCDWLTEQRASLNDSLVKFEERAWSGAGPVPPDQFTPEDADYIIEWSLLLGPNGCFRIEEAYQYDKRDSPAFKDAVVIRTWNGLIARTSVHLPFQAETYQHQGAISSEIQRDLFGKPWTTAIGWWVDLYRTVTLAEIFNSEDVGDVTYEDGVSTWAFTPSFAPSESMRVSAGRTASGQIRLLRIVRDRYKDRAAHSSENRLFRRTYEFDDDVVSGTQISSSIEITYTRDGAAVDRHGEVVWERRQIHSVSNQKHVRSESDFFADFHPAASVWDDRYKIGYELGSRQINIDGRVLLTARPVAGDVGAELAEWIREGVFAETPPSQGSFARTSRWTLSVIMLAAVLLLLLFPRQLLRWLRFRRPTDG